MRFYATIQCIIAVLIVPGPLSSLGATPLTPPPEIVPSALYETAQQLERYGELTRAFRLASFPERRFALPNGLASDLQELRIRVLIKQRAYAHADSLLAPLIPSPEPKHSFLYALTRSRLNYQIGNYQRSLDILSSIDSLSYPLLNDYRSMLKMQILSNLNRTTQAVEVGDRVWRRGVPPALSPEFEQTLLAALEAEQRYQPALRLIRSIKEQSHAKDIVVHFISREMQIYLATGDTARCFELARETANKFATAPIALEFATIAMATAIPHHMATDDLLDFCSVFLNHGESGAAGEILNLLQERTLDEYNLEHTRYLRARLLFLKRQYGTAISLLQVPFNDPQFAKNALLMTARTYRRMKRYQKSAETYVEYGKAYPRAKLAPEALFVAGNLFERTGHSIEAAQVKHYLIDHYPKQYHGRLTTLRLAQEAMREQEYSRAAKLLDSLLKKSAGNQEDIIYYLAQCYQAMGDDPKHLSTVERLRTIDPHSFYLAPEIKPEYDLPEIESRGQIQLVGHNSLLELLDRIDLLQQRAFAVIEQSISSRSASDSSWTANENLRRGAIFLKTGFMDWGVTELDLAYRQLRTNPAALLSLGRMLDRHALSWYSVRAFSRLKYLLRKDRPLVSSGIFTILLYPLPYPGIVLEHCTTYQLPPHLMFAMIREESRFDFTAVSRAGAMGLMQIMPETGREIARELGYPMRNTQVLLIPEVNIAFGMNYAARLLEQCGGSHHMMLCAYNAGIGNATRWFTRKRSDRDLSIQEQVDAINYKETRSYVQRIIESSQRYAELFTRRAPL